MKTEKNDVTIRIKDFGSGMDKETLENIFIPFYSRKDTGTGLGMAIVKTVIEGQHRQPTRRRFRSNNKIAMQNKLILYGSGHDILKTELETIGDSGHNYRFIERNSEIIRTRKNYAFQGTLSGSRSLR